MKTSTSSTTSSMLFILLNSDHFVILIHFHSSILTDRVHLLITHSHSLKNPVERGIIYLQHFFYLSEPDAFSVPFGQLLNPPEPFASEDRPPLVLEYESDQLNKANSNRALQAQAHVVGAHEEAACCHTSLARHPLLVRS